MQRLILVWIVVLGLQTTTSSSAQVAGGPEVPGSSAEAGLASVEVFEGELVSHTQHNDMVEGPDGLLYTGTPRGVLVYDGVGWSRMRSVPSYTIHDLDVGEDGRVWIGSNGEVGVFAPDSVGAMTYASLTEHLGEDASSTNALGEVRGVEVVGDAVFFAVEGRVLRWRDGEGFRSWAVEGVPTLSHVGDALYVHDRVRGLLRFDGAQLRPVPGGQVFTGPDPVAVLSGPPRAVVVTKSGLWTQRGEQFVPLVTAADDYLRGSDINPWESRGLPDGRLAVATQRGGLVLLGPDGTVEAVVDEASGLPGSTVLSVLADRYGGVWVGAAKGIARIAPGPLSLFDDRVGLEGVVLDVARDSSGRLHAATSTGLYRLIPTASPLRSARFERLGGPEKACLDLLVTSEGLLAACMDGVYRIGEGVQRVAAVERAYALGQGGNGLVWVGTQGGALVALTPGTGAWETVPVVEGIKGGILSVYAETDETVWLGTGGGEAVRVRSGPLGEEAADVTHYGPADGLVGTNWVKVWGLGGRPAFGTKTGLYRFHEGAAPAFVLDEDLGEALVEAASAFPNVFLLAAGPGGDVWYHGSEDLAVARNRPEGWEIDRAPLQYLFDLGSYYALAVESDGTAWLGGTMGLFRRAPAPSAELASYPALVRRVATVGADSVLAASHWLGAARAALNAETNALRFEYAAPSFTELLKFRYRLLPLEAEWSPWTEVTAKEYTNLPPGQYTFEVEAEDGRKVRSSVGTFAFEIEPPWYGTAWARALWVLLALGALAALVSGSARWRTRRLREQAQMLEETVAARTAEVEHQRAQLAAQADQLAAQTDQLRALDKTKSRFFANVSHEFRTPLTLTLGPLDDVLAGEYGPVSEEVAAPLGLARRSAGRVLSLINQILDVSRLEAGSTPLHARRLDLGAFAEAQLEAFGPLAAHRHIEVNLTMPDTPVEVWADPEHAGTVLANLLSNAFKFTPEGGRVDVSIEADDREARVTVRDSGPGIAEADLPHIFDRFYQAEGGAGRPLGSGIGLALAHELTALHGGTLTAESEVGSGSVFTLTLPLGHDHLTPEQCDDRSWNGAAVAAQIPENEIAHAAEADLDAEDRTTVLVADDNDDIRAYVRRHLEGAGYRVVEASDGEEALELVRTRLPDLVVSDVMMPRLDGLGLCRALRADPETDFIPIILLTAKAAQEDKLEGLGEACDDYLTKPFEVRELVARVDNLIASRRRLRERFHQEGIGLVLGEDAVVSLFRPSVAGDGSPAAAPASPAESADDAFVVAVREAVEANLSDETFDVGALAEAVGQSRSHLLRKTNALLGAPPSELIRTARLNRAAQLLTTQAGTVSEIAYAVGFKSVAHFSNAFLAHTGCRPSAYAETVQ